MRYPVHGLHLVAAYIGSIAPEGRLVVTSAFQVGDEMRRIQRFAYRMRQLELAHAGFGNRSRQEWQEGAAWQPLRRVLEKLLVTYDFGEAAVALNLVVKPAFDRLFMQCFAALATEEGDRLFAEMLSSLERDCRWQRSCAAAFVRTALEESAENQPVISRWVADWWRAMREAVAALISLWGVDAARAHRFAREVGAECQADWSALGVAEAVDGQEGCASA